jgi:hypothetical protein
MAAYLADVAATRPGLRRILADRFGRVQEVWPCAHDELRRSTSRRLSRLSRTLPKGSPIRASRALRSSTP